MILKLSDSEALQVQTHIHLYFVWSILSITTLQIFSCQVYIFLEL